MRGLLVVIALHVTLAACGPCDTVLAPYCPAGRACWNDMNTEVPAKASRGECAAGAVVCGKDGTPSCLGTAAPSGEVCDGLDNDCDGEADEHAVLLEIPNCQGVFCGACRSAVAACVGGEPLCVSVFQPESERCDGLDNDCDCIIDNDLSPEFFYAGPPFTVGRGQCAPGIRYCAAGAVVEIPAVYPEPELCDGFDNDCDGFVDESDGAPSSYYFVLDVSGSMNQYRVAAAQAFCDFARASPASDRFAVAVVAGSDMPPYSELVQDFADATTTCDTVSGVGFTEPRSGLEYMLEPWGYPTWPGSDTVVIAVTDEALSFFGESGIDYAAAVALCVEEGFSVYVYTPAPFDEDWRPITDVCGGDVLNMPATAGAFREEFAAAFIGQCGTSP